MRKHSLLLKPLVLREGQIVRLEVGFDVNVVYLKRTKIAEPTGSVRHSGIEWSSDDANIKGRIFIAQTFNMPEMSKGRYAGEPPLSQKEGFSV